MLLEFASGVLTGAAALSVIRRKLARKGKVGVRVMWVGVLTPCLSAPTGTTSREHDTSQMSQHNAGW